MRIGILSKRETGLTERLSDFFVRNGHIVSIFTETNLRVNSSLFNNDFFILKSKQLLYLYAGYFIQANNIPVIPDPIISYTHKHRIESYYFLKKCGLKTPHIFMGTSQSIRNQLKPSDYPLIIKPLMGSGSKGISVIKTSKELMNFNNKILYCEKYIKGTHYLAYFIDDQICVGEKQPFANEHGKTKIITPETDIKEALMLWRKKNNLLFGHLDMIREDKTNDLIVVDPGTFPEFSNWIGSNDIVQKISKLILKRYNEIRDNK